jgi:hypothetical protein
MNQRRDGKKQIIGKPGPIFRTGSASLSYKNITTDLFGIQQNSRNQQMVFGIFQADKNVEENRKHGHHIKISGYSRHPW